MKKHLLTGLVLAGAFGLACGNGSGTKRDSGAEAGLPADASPRDVMASDRAAAETQPGADALVDRGADAPALEVGPDSASGDGAVADTSMATGDGSAGDGGPMLSPTAQRGKYLVDVMLSCNDCHTPRLMTGALDFSKYLAGVSCLLDVLPMQAGQGCISSKNLTNHETGLKNVSDDAIKDMILNGKLPDGKFLHPFMPYYEYHNLTAQDADAIVAYLRTVPGVDNRPTASEPPFNQPPTAAAAPVNLNDVPDVAAGAPNAESARRGRYLAAVGCIGCHTKDKEMPGPGDVPIDSSLYFAGGRGFPAAAFGLPVPPFPQVIYTQNLTQHETGIKDWTAADVVKVLKMGKDKMDKGVCPPMPSGPMGNFGGMTDQDAQDIANYIVLLPGKENMLPNQCAIDLP
jgi:mono/diheme cytochrome c family protein